VKLNSLRLEYRPFLESDYDDLEDILSRNEVCLFLPGKTPRTPIQIEKTLTHFIKNFQIEKANVVFAVSIQNQKKVIGYAGLQYVKEYDKTEIMYGFHNDYWKKGFATEASLRMKELAKEWVITDLIALADTENIGSQNVLIKTGFKKMNEVDLWGLHMYYYEMNLLESK
jgi:RimJ/RimL family protein N-acetyltransferase